MSQVVDRKVVQMRFDNSNFQHNVSNTLNSLDKLKNSLNLSGASKGLENVSSAAKRCDMSQLVGSVETVRMKFSALEVMAVTSLANITNSAINAGKRITSALTIDPVKSGFSEYETQINAVQTILANTQSKGTTLDDVNNALDTLNTYADKTIYNFTEMTRNIGTFTAAGIDLETSVNAIQGIANLAAVSGSTSQQASVAMYQLSQALASGTVKLMDWNSVVNAGMGGQVFQDALKETARVHGIAIDDMIKKEGSFRETLSKGWLTSEILTETLQKFTLTTEGLTEEQIEANRAMLKAKGYTDEQIEAIFELGKTATDAATKVKTFTQLWDTLKEAAQSGWTQTWEIIVGDFEEAKTLLTNISNVANEMIGASAQARNELLQGWKDAGGRTDLIDALSNVFEGLMNIIKPIKEAFRDIFPPITIDQLVNFTKGFKNLTEGFREFTENYGDKIKSTFSGIFSVLNIGWTIIQSVVESMSKIFVSALGLSGGLLNISGSLGDFLTNISESIKETDIFGTAIDKITDIIVSVIDEIKEFGSSVKENFKTPGYEGFIGFLNTIWDLVKMIGSGIGDIFSSIGSGISKALGDSSVGDVLNSGIFAWILVGVVKFAKSIANPLESAGGVLENITGILDDVRGCFQAYQDQLKAGTLMKIATAIGVLTASIFVLSTINASDLIKSITAMAIMFKMMMVSLNSFAGISKSFKGTVKAIGIMTSMSIAITILSVALKNISTVNFEGVIKGLLAIGVLMYELSSFLGKTEFKGKVTRSAVGIVILSSAMLILAKAVENFGAMNIPELAKGILSIGALLGILAAFSKYTGNSKNVISTGAAMVLLASSMKIFASSVKDFSTMNLEGLGKGLAGMAGVLIVVSQALKYMPKNIVSIGIGLITFGAAMKVLASSLSDFGGMSLEELGKGLVGMAGALFILTKALTSMNVSLSGSAALIIAAGALSILAHVLKTIGGMTVGEIAKSLITLAISVAGISAACQLLAPLIPIILSLSGAFALFGVATMGIGAGLALIGVGLTSLATAGVAGATGLVAALTVIITGVAGLVPELIEIFGNAISALCVVIAESAPQIANSALILLVEVLKALATYTPQIVDYLMTFLIDVLEAFSNRLPDLIAAAVDVLVAFFQGIGKALSGLDTTGLLQGIVGVGLLSALMLALSSVASLIPGAMVGVLGIGVVIAELSLVLAAIGAFAQIPGLEWLISEGGDLLGTIGTAIGQFIGGIIGGIGQGITNSLPEIATNLSTFMTNLQPFMDGVSGLDASMLEGVKSLAGIILILTAADVLEGITSWLTGGSSIADFALELVPLGQGLQAFANSVAGIDPNSVIESTKAIEALVKIADSLPNSGGIASWFAGDNDLSDFASKLVPLGEGLKNYSIAVIGVDPSAVNASVTAARQIINLINSMVGLDISGVNSFTSALTSLGKVSIDAFVTAFTSSYHRLNTLGSGMVDAITTGVQMRIPTAITTTVALLTDMLNTISSKNTLFQSSGTKLINSLIAGIDGQKLRVKVIIDTILSSTVNSIRSYYQSFYNDGVYLVEGFAAGISNSLYIAEEASKSVAIAAKEAVEEALKIESPSKELYQDGVYFDEGLANGITDTKSEVTDAASDVANSAADAATKSPGLTTSLYDGGKSFANALTTGLTEKLTSNSDVITDAIRKVMSNAIKEGGVAAIPGAIDYVIDTAIQDYNSKVTKSIDNMRSLGILGHIERKSWDEITNEINHAMGEDFSNERAVASGAELAKGLASGISGNTNEVIDAATKIASEAAKAINETLDINSPSKVGYASGFYLIKGFANGIMSYRDALYNVTSDVAESSKNGLNSAISKINEYFSSNIDNTPTIRPVLDLSEIQNGANRINGLFTNQSLSLAGVNANLSNSSAMADKIHKSNESGNAEIVAAITNLRGDVSTLADAIASMHIRMDSGAVVGELIGKIDNSLGKIASHKGRGN